MSRRLTAPLAAAVAALAFATAARADNEDRLYDFTDAYYLKNGVNPAAIAGRRQPDGIRAVADTPFFSYQRPVRVISTAAGYNHSGSPVFFSILGGGNNTLFTPDSAGQKARQIADTYIEYFFPKASAAALDPTPLGGSRQANMLDMRNGYFSANPLGLWLHVWVSYTPQAFSTAAGQAALADLARRNGLDLDGTPIIATLSDMDNLYQKGFVTKRTVPATDGRRYAICPVIVDPTDGGIAPDATLNPLKKPDGSFLEPWFPLNFLSLQKTGRWAD